MNDNLGPQFTTYYHGTQQRNLEGIQREGLTRGMASTRFQDAKGFGSHVLEIHASDEDVKHVHGRVIVAFKRTIPPNKIVAIHKGDQPVYSLRTDT